MAALLPFGHSLAQTPRADKLLNQARVSTDARQRLGFLLQWADDHQSLHRDSMDVWVPTMHGLAEAVGDDRMKALTELAYANWYLRWGWADSALAYIAPVLQQFHANDPAQRDIWYRAMRSRTLCFTGKSRFAEALEDLYQTISIARQAKDSLPLAMACNTIGSVKLAMAKPDEARPWIQQAVGIGRSHPKYREALVPSLINMAMLHLSVEQTGAAASCLEEAIPAAQDIQNLHFYATALRVKSQLLMRQGRLEAAEAMLKEMMAVRFKLTGAPIIVEDNVMLASFYEETGQYQKAIDWCRSLLKKGSLTDTTGTPGNILTNDPKTRYSFLEVLARCLKQSGQTEAYLATMEEMLDAKDSLYAANSALAIAQFQTEYEVKEKEALIASQRLELWKRNLILTVSGVLVVLAVVAAAWAFRRHRTRQLKAMQAEMTRQQQAATAAVQQAEELERRRIAADLHDNLGAHAAAIASNMGMIPPISDDALAGQALQEVRSNASLMVRQLNDTIWALKKESLPMTAIADRVKGFMAQLQGSHPGIAMEVQEQFRSDTVLPAAQAFHLYRLVQEAITNALKHAQATNIVAVFDAGVNWQVQVADNGKGPGSWVQDAGEGSGLVNMRQRSRTCGWDIAWLPNPGGGTLVQVAPTTN